VIRPVFQQQQNGGNAVAPIYRQPIPLLILAAVGVHLMAIPPVLSQAGPSADFESCTAIKADQARLDCFKNLLSNGESGSAAVEKPKPAEDLWPLIKTPRPGGGPDAIAIMRTADTSQSDPDLAGLMIRCGEKPGLEVVLALVRPLPPRSKRDVIIFSGTAQSVLHAETAPPGTALVLPIEATAFTAGPFRDLKQLSVKIIDPESDIRGVIALDGIGAATAKLSASCPSK
jgi:hypothetical protein